MKKLRKVVAFVLLFCMAAVPVAYATGAGEPPPVSTSIYDDILPSESDLKLDAPGVQKQYKKYAPENYGWDTELQIVEMDGIVPKWNDPVSVTINSIAGAVFSIAVFFVRSAIMLLQVGFATNIVTPGLEKIGDKIAMVSENFYMTFFGLASMFTMMFVIKHWAEGTRGQAVKTILLSLLIPALMLGIAQKLPDVSGDVIDAVDAISILSMGATSIDGAVTNEGTARSNGVKRLAESNNLLWLMLVDAPWTIGEFGSATPPGFTKEEKEELQNKGIQVSGNWKDAMLKYEVNHKDRQVLAEVLADEDISHNSEIAPQMLRSKGPYVRIGLAALAFMNSILALILCFLIMIGMLLSGVGFLLCLAAFAIFVLLSMIGDFGRNLVKRYASITLYVVGFKIVVSIFLSLLMIGFYLVEVFELNIYVNQFILAAILAVAIVIFFFLVKRGVSISIRWAAQKMHAIKGEDPRQLLRSLRKGQRHKRVAAPFDVESKRVQRTRPDRETASTRTGSRTPPEPPAGPAAVSPIAPTAVDGSVVPMEAARRRRELAGMGLLQLQGERKGYEQRLGAGESLTPGELQDLAAIQQMERDGIRGRLGVNDRKALDQTWHDGRSLQAQHSAMLQLKETNRKAYQSRGGDGQLSQLENQLIANRQREAQILNPYMKTNAHHTPEEKEAREEMRRYYGDESLGVMQQHAHNDMATGGDVVATGGKTNVEEARAAETTSPLSVSQRQRPDRESGSAIRAASVETGRAATQIERTVEKKGEANPLASSGRVPGKEQGETQAQRTGVDVQSRDLQERRGSVETANVAATKPSAVTEKGKEKESSPLGQTGHKKTGDSKKEKARELSGESRTRDTHPEKTRERVNMEQTTVASIGKSAEKEPVAEQPLTMDQWILQQRKKKAEKQDDAAREPLRKTRVNME